MVPIDLPVINSLVLGKKEIKEKIEIIGFRKRGELTLDPRESAGILMHRKNEQKEL